MAPPPLPLLSHGEIQERNNAGKCIVTLGKKVYDVTDFVDDHPGGADLIREHAGEDVATLMADEVSHKHTEAAYEILDDSLVGVLATERPSAPVDTVAVEANGHAVNGSAGRPLYENTGMSCAEDLSRETDAVVDYKTHKFLDLNKPLFMQVWRSGFSKAFYLEQVHRPRHYRGGDSAPLFGNFLEPLSKTPWWVVPLVWIPPVTYGTWIAGEGLGSTVQLSVYWVLGLAIWTIVEYLLHRFLFHLDGYLPDNRYGITLHFTIHGIHHYLPMDRYRLVMPPTLFVVLATPFWYLAHTIFAYNWYAATAVYCGGIFGYICYDLTHYFLHHRNLPAYYRELKKYHLEHHFADYQNGFGVTSRFWDRVFGTELNIPQPKVIKTS